MTEKLFTDGDDVLFTTTPGKPMQKFKVVSAIWDKNLNLWLYKISNKAGETIFKVEERLLTMD